MGLGVKDARMSILAEQSGSPWSGATQKPSLLFYPGRSTLKHHTSFQPYAFGLNTESVPAGTYALILSKRLCDCRKEPSSPVSSRCVHKNKYTEGLYFHLANLIRHDFVSE